MKVLILAMSIINANQLSQETMEPQCTQVDEGYVCSLGEPKATKPNRYDKCRELEDGVKSCYV
jgi:hypothetical protein